MFAQILLRGVVLSALTLQMFASVAEAAICKPCPAKAVTTDPSFIEAAATALAFPEGNNDSPSPANHGVGDKHRSLCPSCLVPCIGSFPASLSPDDRTQRFAPPECATLYEAPSFSLLRPPIA
jgi:hypothetical protein